MKLIQVPFFAISLLIIDNCIAYNDNIIVLSPPQQTSKEGFFSLRWNNMNSKDNLSLQLSLDKHFSPILKSYKLSSQNQIALSGFNEGRYYFRLTDGFEHQISNSVTVDVKHRTLSSAINLFLLGAILFLILLFALYFSGRYKQQPKLR
ncbi:hypothetical protein [Aliikangiella sp. IMCC44359]|uniref:hypothetical protein n=1 Tax=Aliikangiella sp. IMCC44359 TaxID=3459125 RepID=UPI00403B09BA